MPNLEKESEAESEANPQPATADEALSSNDLARLVGQRLESFRNSGLTHLPQGTGQYEFELVVPEPETVPDAQSRAKAPEVTQPEHRSGNESSNQPAANQPAGVVKESRPQYGKDQSVAQTTESGANPSGATQSNVADAPINSDYGPSLPPEERVAALQVLQDEVARCTKCEDLASTRSQTVFGVGNPSTRLVLLGEGPGAEEDRVGEPFVGAAGQLLDKIISACNLSRSDVYILNTVKCRPPGNRNPSQSELANCWGYAERQLEILQPEFICCLGSVAARTLLKTTLSIGKLRRQLHSYRGSRVLVTYHPAYLLRTPSAKKHVWEDMQFLMKEMGIKLSK